MIAPHEHELIGPARDVELVFRCKAVRLKKAAASPLKVLFYGAPGVGKTDLAFRVARDLAGHELAIEHANGKEVTVETVRAWIADLGRASLWGDWQVQIVDELDRCSRDAQDLLLTYLDRLPPCRAFIGTSNLQLDLLQERFQTRLQQFKIETPDTAALVSFLASYDFGGYELPDQIAQQVAVGSGGNVRAALLDAESYMDTVAVSRPGKKGGRK